MIRRQHQQQFLFEERFDFEMLGDHWQGQDGEVDLAVAATLDQVLSGVLEDHHRDVLVELGKPAQ